MINNIRLDSPNTEPVKEKGLWEHTIGRLSNLVRIPINILASIFQGLKIGAKVLALPVTYAIIGINHLISKNKEDSYQGMMSLRGIALNTVGLCALLKGIDRCYIRTYIAPKKTDPDLIKGLTSTFSVLTGTGVWDDAESQVAVNILSIRGLFNRLIFGERKT